jgi:hypothetical protein
MTALTIETNNAEKLSSLKAFLKVIHLSYKTGKTAPEEAPYNPEFVSKVLKAKDETSIPMTLDEFEQRFLL